QGFHGHHILVFERTRGAELHTLRIAVAEITIMSHALVRREPHHAERTGEQAHLAANAAIGNDLDLAVGLALNRYGRAYCCARRIGTMYAHHRLIELLFVEISNPDTRERG